MKTEMFDGKDTNPDNRKKNIKEDNKNNIELTIADIYLYAVIITRMYQKKQDVTHCLKSLMLSYLHHFLRILDKVTIITTCNIYYNLNLFYLNFKISQKLNINNKISTIITDIQKDIYKTALTKKKTGENNKLNNLLNFVYIYIIQTRLSKQLILTISTGLIFKAVTSHFLDILLPNSDFIIVYNCIHLLLLLNQLQYLTVEGILNYAIKNK